MEGEVSLSCSSVTGSYTEPIYSSTHMHTIQAVFVSLCHEKRSFALKYANFSAQSFDDSFQASDWSWFRQQLAGSSTVRLPGIFIDSDGEEYSVLRCDFGEHNHNVNLGLAYSLKSIYLILASTLITYKWRRLFRLLVKSFIYNYNLRATTHADLIFHNFMIKNNIRRKLLTMKLVNMKHCVLT